MNQAKSKKISSKEEIRECNVAMYFNMATMSPVIELHAALLRDLLSRNNRITVYLNTGSFKSPTDNPFNRASINSFSYFRAMDALKDVDVTIKELDIFDHSALVPKNIQKSLNIAVMSSLASGTKAQNKEQLNKKWLGVYQDMKESSNKLYNYFFQEIRNKDYDFLFMFNGRFGCVKPALEAAKSTGIGYGLCEVKKTVNEIVFINELVHSIDGNTRRAVSFYEKNKERAEKNALNFFGKKINNQNTGDPIYTKSQTKGSLPTEVQETHKKIITIYPTTDDEYKFIGDEWDGEVPDSQIDEIDELASSLPKNEYLIVVKMHPNQVNTAEDTLALYKSLADKYDNLIVEGPLSKKDTYALMYRSDVVVTFASTIGVEACYAGKSVVLIGDTTFSKMNIAHQTYSGSEAAGLIKKGIEPKPKKGAIIWGNYLAAYKDVLPAYTMVGNGEYLVSNRKIGSSVIRRILQLPAKLEIEVSKPGFKFGMGFVKRIQDVTINIIKGKWAIK